MTELYQNTQRVHIILTVSFKNYIIFAVVKA